MKAVPIKKIKSELSLRSPQDLAQLCIQLSKFKKENKELLTYLLFEAHDEEMYVKSVKDCIDDLFAKINPKSFFYIRKSIRKILRITKKYILYSKKKETEVQLLLHFCSHLKEFTPSISNSIGLQNMYERQIVLIKKAMRTLHEDVQFEYRLEINDLQNA